MKTKITILAALMGGALIAGAADRSYSADGDRTMVLKKVNQGRAGITYRMVERPEHRTVRSSEPARPVTIGLSVEEDGWTSTRDRDAVRNLSHGRSGFVYRHRAPRSNR